MASEDVSNRLKKVKASVQKAMQEALQHLHFENDDPNSSFHLGMELFGQETSVLEVNVQSKLNVIETELVDVLESIKSTGHKDTQQLEAESAVLRVKIQFLQHCSIARALLDESITLSTPVLAPNAEPDLQSAVEKLNGANNAKNEAQSILEKAQDNNPKSPALQPAYAILDSFNAGLRRQRLDLVSAATKTWHTSVSLSENCLVVSAPLQLSAAYDVLEAIEDDKKTLELTLRRFTRNLHKTVFEELIQIHTKGKPTSARTVLEHHDTITNRSTRRLEWNDDDNDMNVANSVPNKVTGWKPTMDFIERVLVFVADHVLLQRPYLCDFVATRLFGNPTALPTALNLEALGLESCRLGDDNGLLMEPLVEALEQTCVPKVLEASELGQLQSIAGELEDILDPFLQVLAKKKLVPEGPSRLATFATTFEQKYVDNRHCELLHQARSLLLSNDYHNTVQVGEEIERNLKDEALGLKDGLAVFKLHQANISDTAFKLMSMCRIIMDEAASIPVFPAASPLSVLAATLYRTAREALDLFRAIIPVSHGQEVATVPRTAAVLHNDCVFFAHNCLTLGLEYKGKFPEVPNNDAKGNLLRQTCMFVDMVPLFRELADRSLGEMLSMQRKQLKELVADRITLMGQALRSNEILAEWSEAETALAAGLYHLRHLSQSWKPILSYDIWNRSVCHLTDAILTMFLNQVGQAPKISSSGSQFVLSLFRKATNDLEALLQGNTAESRVWERFTAVGTFFDMSISDIQAGLSDGVFRSVTAQELSKLVTACFGETPKRQHLLKLLSQGS